MDPATLIGIFQLANLAIPQITKLAITLTHKDGSTTEVILDKNVAAVAAAIQQGKDFLASLEQKGGGR